MEMTLAKGLHAQEDFARFQKEDITRSAKIIREGNIRAE